MKKYKSLLWGLMLAIPTIVSITGCKKFLDRKPLQSTLDDLNQGALEGQVLGMYTILRTYAGFSTLPWLDFHSIRDDDAQKGSDASDGKEVNAEFETFLYSKDDWAPNTYWNDRYAMINAANSALHLADSLQVSDAASLRNIGEACFFRAYSYFDLVKTYGDVPLFNYKIVNPTDGIRPKSPASVLYAFIDSNLQVAAARLPLTAEDYGPGYTGRLTRGAANALWAQTYLFRQNWARVVSLCNEIKTSNVYSLSGKFPDIWKDTKDGVGKNGPESIFEMQANVGQNGQSNGKVNNGVDWGTCQNVRQNGATNDWNLGWGWNTPTDNLEAAWDNTDPRKRQTILYSGQYDGGDAQGGYGATLPIYTNPDGTGGLAQKFWNKKVYSDPAMRIYTGFNKANGAAPWINHRIIRYAEVLLMLAEASNELNDGPTAEANLELIRDRASGKLGPARTVVPKIAFANQAQMRTAIKNERRWEFAMEGLRFYDLVRWGDATSVLGGLGYTNRCRFYPIPQKAIDLSGGVLKQNPEW
ncbi:MAG TPA: RagB/SusD family nutrient uptake outer membrane protein [Chitinophagaceae bacterium]|nr:RagB/SusD family nutrient uptake outer membrane protein [Chitinophagaceae bacterium]